MSHITLVRHGQANSGARDEKSYDRLSPLGHQQAQWLGDHFRDVAAQYTRVYCGTLRRHAETAVGMGYDDFATDPRLNEVPYFSLAQLLEEQTGLPVPVEREGFVRHVPVVYKTWQEDGIENAPMSFQTYVDDVLTALAEIAAGEGPALVVTSGGLISLVMRDVLGLDIPSTARLTLAIMNTSMHRIFPIGDAMTPVLFNAVPHLDRPDRQHARTHI